MRDLLILFLGCIFGTCIGLVVLGLCFAARAEKPKQAGYQPKRPTEPPKPPTTGSNAQKPTEFSFVYNHSGPALFRKIEQGKWEESFSYGSWHYDCPFCGDGYAVREKDKRPQKYCHNCGAKLSGAKPKKEADQ